MTFTDRNIAILPNPTRESAVLIGQQISLLLSGIDVKHFLFHSWPADFFSYSEVWIIGGDGTVNFFINKYPDIAIPLAVFKGGTGNDFHWMLYGEVEMEAQVEKVLYGNSIFVDAGRCNERLFLNNLGIGFDARVTRDLVQRKKKPGKTSYLISVLKHILFFRSFQAILEVDKRRESGDFFMLNICNGKRTGGGFYLAPGALLDDGKLNINVIHSLHPLRRLWYLPMIEKGKHFNRKFSFLDQFATTSLVFRADKLLHAHVDGEYFQDKKFVIQCLPKRFSFLA